jgi:SAM-dependent methyltransferase
MGCCPACGSVQSVSGERSVVEVGGERQQYVVFRCTDCGTEFAEPRRPAPPEWYERVEYYGWRWEFDVAIQVLEQRGWSRVLEVGCGEGVLLDKLKSQGEVWGVDINRAAVLRARERGIHAFCGSLEDFVVIAHRSVQFDAVLFFHLLEHLGDPLLFLQDCRRILRPRGWILLSIPNERRFTLRLGHEWWDGPPHHLSRFSRRGLFILLGRAGFRVVATRDQPNDVSPRLWASLLAERVLSIASGRHVRFWRPWCRRIAKVVLFPLGYLHYAGWRIRADNYTGLSLFVIAEAD